MEWGGIITAIVLITCTIWGEILYLITVYIFAVSLGSKQVKIINKLDLILFWNWKRKPCNQTWRQTFNRRYLKFSLSLYLPHASICKKSLHPVSLHSWKKSHSPLLLSKYIILNGHWLLYELCPFKDEYVFFLTFFYCKVNTILKERKKNKVTNKNSQ